MRIFLFSFAYGGLVFNVLGDKKTRNIRKSVHIHTTSSWERLFERNYFITGHLQLQSMYNRTKSLKHHFVKGYEFYSIGLYTYLHHLLLLISESFLNNLNFFIQWICCGMIFMLTDSLNWLWMKYNGSFCWECTYPVMFFRAELQILTNTSILILSQMFDVNVL